MKNITVIGGFGLNYKLLSFLNNLASVKYFDINQFPSTFNLKNISRTISQSLDFDNNILIAYSMGGLIAIDMVDSNPDKFSRVILLNSTPCFMEKPGWQGISVNNFKILQQKLVAASLDDFYKYFITMIASPNTRPEQYEMLKSNTTTAQLVNLLHIIYNTDFRNKLLAIKNKFTLINAQNDVLIKDNFLNIRRYWISNASHLDIIHAREIILRELNQNANT